MFEGVNETILKGFALFGVMTIAVFIGILAYALISWIKYKIEEVIYIYRIKHRFNGKPIAKCWCRDCRRRGKDDRCTLFGAYTQDNGFCYRAIPERKEMERMQDGR